MLLCHSCHQKIDQNPEKYPSELLTKWKLNHEKRIALVTGISSNKKSNIIFYLSNIGDQKSPIQKVDAFEAIFPEHYPANEEPIILSMISSYKDRTPEFWEIELKHLEMEFLIQIEKAIIERNNNNNPAHFSLFALAPIPLLIKLGSLFTDKIDVDVYQLMREPKTWKWQTFPEGYNFIIKEPKAFNNPHIFPQSLFMLGTAIRPIGEAEEYDLDLVCKLRMGFNKNNCTQESIKKIVGKELELYREARGIKEELESKHRCWRLNYHDDLSFHMDIVPSIPADESIQNSIFESMINFNEEEYVSLLASKATISITDDRHDGYTTICDDWNISNPEGYRTWFENRMSTNQKQILLAKAQVDDVPIYSKKTILQRSIQLLKRHRDQMLGDNESKPISIIITTLASRAYNGETDLESAILNILNNMEKYIYPDTPRVPNPVNPNEDFADRWSMPKYSYLELELNFRNWVKQAKADFKHIISTLDTEFIKEQAELKFSISINKDRLSEKFGIIDDRPIHRRPKEHNITEATKPWQFGN